MLLPENVTEKNNGFTKPANIPHLDIVQKVDWKGDETNSLTSTIHSPQETAGASEMQAGSQPSAMQRWFKEKQLRVAASKWKNHRDTPEKKNCWDRRLDPWPVIPSAQGDLGSHSFQGNQQGSSGDEVQEKNSPSIILSQNTLSSWHQKEWLSPPSSCWLPSAWFYQTSLSILLLFSLSIPVNNIE